MSESRVEQHRSFPFMLTYQPLFRFLFLGLFVLTASRLILTGLWWNRVTLQQLGPVLLGGLRIDLTLLGMFAVAPAVLVSLFSGSARLRTWEARYYRFVLALFILLELTTPTFISQYDTRPDRLFFEYLTYPQEVSSMLVKGFGNSVLFVLLGTTIGLFLVFKILRRGPTTKLSLPHRGIAAMTCGFVGFVMIRGTLNHKPINPATVAFSSDRMVNTLPLNSAYSILYAAYRLKDEKNAGALYGTMPEEEMHRLVLSRAGISGSKPNPRIPSLHYQKASKLRATAPHIVVILEESLGARYVGHLTGGNLTPELDTLAAKAWTFKNLYATGTRSVRGIEAVITGFLPTPARAVVKLGLAQGNFFTLASLVKRHGYTSTFIYGGESHFDNMKGFLLNNGFDRTIDRSAFTNPVLAGSWGVSDEDMLNRLHEELTAAVSPQLFFAFSVTNHSPYEYPKNRIKPTPPSDATAENAVRYADWALGDFFKKAQSANYYKNTIFLVVADHDSRVYGANTIPVEHFHIPALILGGGIQAKSDERLVSQIDLAPTLLSLAGISGTHPMLGHDLTTMAEDWQGRAIMQYGENFGYREGSQLMVFRPQLGARQYRVVNDQKLVEEKYINQEFRRVALAHALWPSWAYANRRYSLGDSPAELPVVQAHSDKAETAKKL